MKDNSSQTASALVDLGPNAGGPEPPRPPSLDELYQGWKAKPGEETLSPLIRELGPTIDGQLRRHNLHSDPNIHLSARIHLARELEKYDPSRAGLKTWAGQTLQRMTRTASQYRTPIKVSEGAAMDSRYVEEVRQAFEYEEGRPPSLQELADKTGLSMRRLRDVHQKARPYAVAGVQEDDGESGGLQDVGTGKVDDEDLFTESFYSALSPEDQYLFERLSGYGGVAILPQAKIASKLKRSPAWVNKRAKALQDQYEELMDAAEGLVNE